MATKAEKETHRLLSVLVELNKHLLVEMKERNRIMSVEMDNLLAGVQATKDAYASGVAAFVKLGELIGQNANDPAKVQELADELKSRAGEFVAAIPVQAQPTPTQA